MRRIGVLLAAGMTVLLPWSAGAQLVGSGSGGDNLLPFGGPPSATIYQQLYAASNFAGPGFLQAVTFFRSAQAGTLRPGTYDLFVSTTSVPLNGLSNVNFDGNRGANNLLFGSYALGDPAPLELTFAGVPFFYNPALGNLLLDFRITGTVFGGATYRADANAIGVFSRTFNGPGSGFEGWGLQTRFTIVSTVPEPATLAMVGAGVLVLFGIRRRGNV